MRLDDHEVQGSEVGGRRAPSMTSFLGSTANGISPNVAVDASGLEVSDIASANLPDCERPYDKTHTLSISIVQTVDPYCVTML